MLDQKEQGIFIKTYFGMNINKKVLVTGADGFIGSHLVEELLAQGFQVKAFCYYNAFNSWGWLDSL